MVAVQDCGLVINEKLAESQVYGALIMGVSTALYEERVADPVTGRVLNPNMEFYKLAAIADVGEFKVHLMPGPGYDERGVIGLGEPPVISPVAAIGNAVANAIGVRVPQVPFTPERVLAALADTRGERLMRAFEYASPTTVEEAVALLAAGGWQGRGARRRHRSAELDEGRRRAPERLINLKSIASMRGIERAKDGALRIGALATIDDLLASAEAAAYPALLHAADGIRSPQLRNMGTVGGELLQRPRCWYYRAGFGLLAQRDGRSMVVDGDNRYHAILGNEGPAYFVHASSLAPALIALGARVRIVGPERAARGGARRALPRAVARRRARDDARSRARSSPRSWCRRPPRARHLRGAPARVAGLAARRRGGGARDGRRHREDGARRPRARGADAVRRPPARRTALAGKKLDDAGDRGGGRRRGRGRASRCRATPTRCSSRAWPPAARSCAPPVGRCDHGPRSHRLASAPVPPAALEGDVHRDRAHAADADIPSMSDGFVWCTHTQNCLGPDGRVADVDTCLPGRACWER